MQELKISFNSLNEETGIDERIIQTFPCTINNNIISYIDTNNTNHSLRIEEKELFIESSGEFEVKNHYIEDEKTSLSLVHVEKQQKFELIIKTEKLIIEKNKENIKIELNYKLFEENSFISDHEINIEVY